VFTSCIAIAFFEDLTQSLGNNYEKPNSAYVLPFFLYSKPKFVQKMIVSLVSLLMSKRAALTMGCIKQFTGEEIDDIYRRKKRLEDRIKEKWENLQLDAVISPTSYHSAFKSCDANELALLG